MSLLSAADIASIREALEISLTHRCTITPMIVGAEDAEGNMPVVAGTPVTGVACRYETISRAVRDEGGTTLVSVPALTVSATAAIAIGSRVSAITDQLGATLLDGPARVERVLDDTAGLGAPLLPTYELRAGAVSS